MKRVMFIATLLSGIAVLSAFKSTNKVESTKTESLAASDFCDGWEDGYCEALVEKINLKETIKQLTE